MRRLIAAFALSTAVAAGAPAVHAQGVVAIDPRAAFLHTNSDAAPNAVGISLAAYGVAPGDSVTLKRLGDFDNGPGADTFTSMIGVLSASNVLLSATLVNRVQDALDTGVDFVTGFTYYGSQATDIPQDFAISVTGIDSATVYVPAGAAYLFVCPPDQLFYDNSDPDGDYAVRIARKAPVGIGEPGDAPGSGLTVRSPARLPVHVVFARPADRPVALSVRDVRGRLIATLPPAPAGAREVVWNGETGGGGTAPAGLYVFSAGGSRAAPGVRVVILR